MGSRVRSPPDRQKTVSVIIETVFYSFKNSKTIFENLSGSSSKGDNLNPQFWLSMNPCKNSKSFFVSRSPCVVSRTPSLKLRCIQCVVSRFHFFLIGIQISSSDSGSLFLYFSPNTSKCGLWSRR
jgi:hypothetical protein